MVFDGIVIVSDGVLEGPMVLVGFLMALVRCLMALLWCPWGCEGVLWHW